jgi:hypothetical protein
MRIGQVRLRGVAAMAVLANDTAVKPRRRQRRARGAERSAATRVSPCAVRASRGRPGGVIAKEAQGASKDQSLLRNCSLTALVTSWRGS